MLVFGHVGVTLAVFLILGFLVHALRAHIDNRYVAFGSMLPDIIDKPIGRVLFAESIANGRIIAHTLMFSILIFVAGYYLYKRKGDSRIAIIAGASFCHLLEDGMWKQPVTFFWPLYGWEFPQGSPMGTMDYFFLMFSRSFSLDLSHVLSFEFAGFVLVTLLIMNSLRKRLWWRNNG